MSAIKFFQNSNFFLNLKPISIKEIGYLKIAPCNIFFQNGDTFELVYKKDSPISVEQLKVLETKEINSLLIHHIDMKEIRNAVKSNLITTSRSLSIGNSLNNAKKLCFLLSINLKYIYQDPTNDELLTIQVQSAVNFAKYLSMNERHHNELYQEVLEHDFHYIYAQPLISSLLLLGFLSNNRLFNPKEIETLFLTSYLKDIGMSLIPLKKWNKTELSLSLIHI